MQTLTADMRAVIESAQLCFAATVTPDGRPSLSPRGAFAAVVVLTVERAAALFSPAYACGDDETALRALWRERRAQLDREFEAHLARMNASRREGGA